MLAIYFFWLIFLSPNYEHKVVSFCNELVIGANETVVLAEAKKISDTHLSNVGEGIRVTLSSDGLTSAYCTMEFKEKELSKKTLSLS